MLARLLVCSSLVAFSVFGDTEHRQDAFIFTYKNSECNYEPTGDVTKASAVPINNFKTGGSDQFRNNFCIGHCVDRKSLRASMVFNLQNSSSSSASADLNFSRRISGDFMTAQSDAVNYCVDSSVSAIVDNVFQSSNDLDTMTVALNKNLNKPGWAWVLFEANYSPSLVFVFNAFQDVNFCHKIKHTEYNLTSWNDFYFIGGLIL